MLIILMQHYCLVDSRVKHFFAGIKTGRKKGQATSYAYAVEESYRSKSLTRVGSILGGKSEISQLLYMRAFDPWSPR